MLDNRADKQTAHVLIQGIPSNLTPSCLDQNEKFLQHIWGKIKPGK